jgi:hypothetical protein
MTFYHCALRATKQRLIGRMPVLRCSRVLAHSVQYRATACSSRLPATPKVETKIGLESGFPPPTKGIGTGDNVGLYSQASELDLRRMLKGLVGRSRQLENQRERLPFRESQNFFI